MNSPIPRAVGSVLAGWLLLSFLAANNPAAAAPDNASDYASVRAQRPLRFPADYGSHPDFRTEWWYVTGWLKTQQGEPLGFQITFFRSKPATDAANPSAFAPRQLLIAHCALSDPKRGRLWQDQRIRRAGMQLAEAAEGDTNVWIERWSLKREDEKYLAKIDAEDFSLDLALAETQAVLLNGDAGISRKGPLPQAASYYYSLPHLKVSGSISRKGAQIPGERRGVVRSRMVQRVSGCRGDWLGLDRHQSGRRRRADGVPHPRAARRAALGRRHVSQRRGPGADLAARGY